MAKKEYPSGLDCIWVARDKGHRVGAFITGGSGPIPAKCFELPIAIEENEDLIFGLPIATTERLIVRYQRPDDFIELSKRGFFVFDWSDVHKTTKNKTDRYELIAAPMNPIVAGVLPATLLEQVNGVDLDLDFLSEQSIRIQSYQLCIEPESW